MLPKHSHGVVGFSETIATLLAARKWVGEAGRRFLRSGGFREDQGRFKKDELLRPDML